MFQYRYLIRVTEMKLKNLTVFVVVLFCFVLLYFIYQVNKSVHCKGMWDKLNCWPPAALGETVSQPCPDHEFFNSEGEMWHT